MRSSCSRRVRPRSLGCLSTTLPGKTICDSTDTDVLQAVTAVQFAPVAGATYTTTNGFVFVGDQKSFQKFQVTFSSATTHYIAYLQVAGGEDTLPNKTPQATSAPASVSQTGVMTASGGVAAGYGPGGAGSGSPAAPSRSSGGRGGGISRRT